MASETVDFSQLPVNSHSDGGPSILKLMEPDLAKKEQMVAVFDGIFGLFFFFFRKSDHTF